MRGHCLVQGSICLQLDRRELYTDTTSQDEQPEDAALSEVEVEHAPPSNGIRLSRGHGLPWDASRWTSPRTVITGDNPANCADRRPHYTGYPRLTACQFDGRLSLARDLGGRFLLYARANLGECGGWRHVQMTSSADGVRGWSRWRLLEFDSFSPSESDGIYFAAVRPLVGGLPPGAGGSGAGAPLQTTAPEVLNDINTARNPSLGCPAFDHIQGWSVLLQCIGYEQIQVTCKSLTSSSQVFYIF